MSRSRQKSTFKIQFYKQWWFPLIAAGILIPSVGLIWSQANQVWGAPQEVKTLKEAVIQNSNTQADLTKIVQQQKERNDQQDSEIEKQKEISQLQIDSLREIIKSVKK